MFVLESILIEFESIHFAILFRLDSFVFKRVIFREATSIIEIIILGRSLLSDNPFSSSLNHCNFFDFLMFSRESYRNTLIKWLNMPQRHVSF